jgi:hypothetical protein
VKIEMSFLLVDKNVPFAVIIGKFLADEIILEI